MYESLQSTVYFWIIVIIGAQHNLGLDLSIIIDLLFAVWKWSNLLDFLIYQLMHRWHAYFPW